MKNYSDHRHYRDQLKMTVNSIKIDQIKPETLDINNATPSHNPEKISHPRIGLTGREEDAEMKFAGGTEIHQMYLDPP